MRPSKDHYFMSIALVVAQRATCVRRAVGCVIIDSRGNILSTGYNGVARGLPHCIDNPCGGACHASGTHLDACEAIHAEVNAILQCHNVYEIDTIYSTTSTCVNCAKLILGTSCERIVFLHEYPQTMGDKLLDQKGIGIRHLTDEIGLSEVLRNATKNIYEPKTVEWINDHAI